MARYTVVRRVRQPEPVPGVHTPAAPVINRFDARTLPQANKSFDLAVRFLLPGEELILGDNKTGTHLRNAYGPAASEGGAK